MKPTEFTYQEFMLLQESILSRIQAIERLLKSWENDIDYPGTKELYLSYSKDIDKLRQLSDKIKVIF
jgi:hypothetical protein